MSLRTMRTAVAYVLKIAILASPACVVRLSERNEPLPNGGVSGPAADCRVVQPLPKGGPGAAPATKFVGRYDMTDPARPSFDWSGNYMTTRFQGTEVTWGLESDTEMVLEQIIDDGPGEQVILGGEQPFARTVKLPAGTHEITVVRSSEALFGLTRFIPFTFGNGTQQLPPTERPRRIEIIGDSITCGYGNEGPNATCPYDVVVRKVGDEEVKIPETQNIYLAYGSIAARNLSAEAVTLCFSGKGVVLNYREQGVGEGAKLNPNDRPDPDAKVTIPEYFRRTRATINPNITCTIETEKAKPNPKLDPKKPPECVSETCSASLCRCKTSADCCEAKNDADCEAANNKCVPAPRDAGGTGNTCHNHEYQEWDYAKEPEPQVVLINIGQNDFGRDTDLNSIADGIDLNAFRAGYKNFLGFVRSKRPNAHIFIAVSPMVSDKFPLDNARSDMRATLRGIAEEFNAAGDVKVYSMELVEMGVRYGLGCDYHPNLAVHGLMAQQVEGAIRSKTCW